MASRNIGKMSVRVLPDTSRFRQDVKKSLERAERTLKATIKVDVALNKDSLAKVKSQLESLAADVKIGVDTKGLSAKAKAAGNAARKAVGDIEVDVKPEVSTFDRVWIARVQSQVRRALNDVEAELSVDVDGETVRRELKAIAEQIEKSVSAEIPVDVEESASWRATIRNLVREIESYKPVVDVHAEWRDGVRAELEESIKKIEADVPLNARGDKFRQQIESIIRKAEAAIEAEIPVAAEESETFKANVARMVAEVQSQTARLRVDPTMQKGARARLKAAVRGLRTELPVDLKAKTARFRAEVAAATRPESKQIFLKVDTAPLKALSEAFAALSGGRVLRGFGQHFVSMVGHLDRAVPMMALLGNAMGVIASLGVATFGSLMAVASGLGQMVRALVLVAPAAVLGFATHLGVLIAALQDTKDVLGDLGPQFGALQDKISVAFWSEAEGAVRKFVAAYMPLANEYLPRIAKGLGDWIDSFSRAMTSARGVENMSMFLENIAIATEKASDGFAYFGSFLHQIAVIGSQYLVRLGDAFTDTMQSWDNWIDNARATGEIWDMIDAGIENLKAFGSILASTTKIIGGFARAAEAAGSNGLIGMAEGMKRFADAVNSPGWQKALTGVFKASYDSVALLGPGLERLGEAFKTLAPTIGNVSRLSAQFVSVGLGAIADILEAPGFRKGLEAFFEGALKGIENLAPYMDLLGDKFGAFLETAGVFAEEFGKVLGAGLKEFGPIIDDILGAVAALAPVLSGALIGALEMLGPPIRAVVTAVADWVKENPELAATIAAVVGALAGLLIGALRVISLVGEMTKAFANIKLAFSVFKGLGPILKGLLAIFTGLSGWVVLLVIALVAAAAAIYLHWDEIVAWTKEKWDGLLNWFDSWWPDLIGGFVNWLKELGGKFTQSMSELGAAWAEGWASLGSDLEAIGQGWSQWWSDLWGGFKNGLSDGLAALKDGWSTGWADFTAGLQELGAGLAELWDSMWTPLAESASGVMTAVSARFSEEWASFTEGMAGLWEGFSQGWNDFWGGLGENLAPLKESLGALGDFLTVFFGESILAILESFINVWDEGWDGVIRAFDEANQSIIESFHAFKDKFFGGWNEAMGRLAADMSAWWDQTWGGFVNWLSDLKTGFVTWCDETEEAWRQGWHDFWVAFGEKAQQIKDDTIQWLIDMGTSFATWLSETKDKWVQGWNDFWATLGEKASQMLADAGQWLADMGVAFTTWLYDTKEAWVQGWNDFWATLGEKTSQMLTDFAQWGRDMWAEFVEFCDSVDEKWYQFWEDVKKKGKQAIDDFIGSLIQFGKDVDREFGELKTKALKTLEELPGKMAQMGRDIIGGLLRGIKEKSKELANAIAAPVNDMVNSAKSRLGIKSPSRVFMEIGQYVDEGLAKGIDRDADKVRKSVARMLPTAETVNLGTIDSEVAIRNHGSFVAGQLPNLLAEALDGTEVILDGRKTVGALSTVRRT